MNKQTIKRWIENPWTIGVSLARRGWLNKLSDKAYLSIIYRANLKKKMNWKEPKTFNEKLQWLKINDRQPIYSTMVDKYEVKQYVSDKIGEEHVIPTVGGPWNTPDEIDFDALPDQFVLKTTHDCGGAVICKDKRGLDQNKTKEFLQKHLQHKYFFYCREWPYKNVPPRIFAEQFISDEVNKVLPVYKIFCFQGNPRIIQAIMNDKQENETVDYYDTQWERLTIKQVFPNSEKPLPRPEQLDTMLYIAKELSKGHPFIRIDLYEANHQVLFSEFTFYSDAGLGKFEPEEWDEILGSWLILPERGDGR